MDVNTKEGIIATLVAMLPILGKLYMSHREATKKKIASRKKREEALDRIDDIYKEFIQNENSFVSKLEQVAKDIRKLQCEVTDLKFEIEADKRIAGEALFECNEQGECSWASIALCKMFRLTEEEMMGFGWTSRIVEPERELAKEQWMQDMKANHVINRQYHIKTERIWLIKYTAVVIRDKNGNVRKVRGVCHRHQPEKNLFN